MRNNLTIREREVGIFLLSGLTAKQISKRMGISLHTVEGYQRILKKKLRGKTPYQLGGLLLKQFAEEEEKSCKKTQPTPHA